MCSVAAAAAVVVYCTAAYSVLLLDSGSLL